ncbi:MAG: hypothetical protein E6J90_39915 [Deltaproteobacteria bacterium]|nr:MAG: hypothetical protein E6J90_39915 [Deltaproteobacteria bacterium]TMQ13303.1 MAG: hypothetical protein E6J91_18775 [Deltaproteobacteria bacterium]
MPVTLESRTRRMQVFHLSHEVFCRGRCACSEVTVVVTAENPRTGERAPRRLQKKVPGSITVLARERKPGLPSAVLELAEVKAAIARGYLRIVEQTPDGAAQPRTESTPPALPANAAASAPNTPAAAGTPTAGPSAAAPASAADAKSAGKEP